ncbi:MAG: PIG-L deacetylase family protein [Steroidobacteraceae bacterium]
MSCSNGSASGANDLGLVRGALIALGLLLLGATVARAADYPLSDLAAIGPADRILIVSPHPDDESLCCAGVIERALAAGAQVDIVWLTSGDAFELDARWVERTLRPGQAGLRKLGLRRMREARTAATRLGVPARDQFFLGFPDRGLLPLIVDHLYVPYTSPYTGLAAVRYPGTVDRGASYEGETLQDELAALLDRIDPTYVLAPSPLDTHPDHRAAGSLVIRTMGRRHRLDRVRYWIVHAGRHWPAPRGLHASAPLLAPPRATGMAWERVPLDAAQQRAKLDALSAYGTQMIGLERRFLLAFVRENELFARSALPVK